MDDIAGTGLAADETGDTAVPSQLVVILDTNPYAWSDLSLQITLNQTVSDLIVFINAHLACNHANRVAVLASHCTESVWLYPSSPNVLHHRRDRGALTDPISNPNKYRPFALVEHELKHNLHSLFRDTTTEDLRAAPTSTTLAGSLTMAVSYISKTVSMTGLSVSSASLSADPASQSSDRAIPNARILLLSTSGNLAMQYIPLMNIIFAAQNLHIPLDIVKLAGDIVLLEQASYTTSGVFLAPNSVSPFKDKDSLENGSENRSIPSSLLPTLLFAFLPDPDTRRHLVPPTATNVDFRAACFCHRRVVDIGHVCSICLSIFCEEGVATYMSKDISDHAPGVGTCLTCGTILNMTAFGNRGLADRRRKRVKKKRNQSGIQESME